MQTEKGDNTESSVWRSTVVHLRRYYASQNPALFRHISSPPESWSKRPAWVEAERIDRVNFSYGEKGALNPLHENPSLIR